MTTLQGFDTWGEGPTPADAQAAGMAFRTWYSSYDGSKDGPVSGPADYAAVGIWSVTNFETTIDRVLTGGYAGGQQDMMHTINEYATRGMPVGATVILSADEPIPASAFPQALTYYQGARQAAARQYLTGCYGEQALIAYLKQQGAIDIGWRSMSTAWPGGTSTDHCDLIQTSSDKSAQIGGIAIDWDTALVPFFGQWMPGKLAPVNADPPPVRRNDMHADLKPNTPVVFTNPAAVLGGTSYLLLASDFGDATVRIATFNLKTGWNVLPLATIGRTAGAYKLAMLPDVNKVNVEMTGGSGAVGLDVLA